MKKRYEFIEIEILRTQTLDLLTVSGGDEDEEILDIIEGEDPIIKDPY